jgi:dUTP pyrophosphatase
MPPKPLIKVVKTAQRVVLPQYESDGASGMDIRAFLDTDVTIPSLGRVKIPTGLKVEIPSGYEAQVRSRSGLAVKSGVAVLNSPGTIDSDYRGDVEIILVNLGAQDVVIKDGERIAQLVITPVCHAVIAVVDTLDETKRGSGGFGSTGNN